MFLEAAKKHKGLKLGSDDCVLFISGSGKILRFVYGFTEQEVVSGGRRYTGEQTQILETSVYRIIGGGRWSPLMLKNYADECGLELVGLKRFEEHYSNSRK